MKGREGIKYLTSHVVLTKALGLLPKDMRASEMNRLSKVLRRLGLEPRRVRLAPSEIAAWKRLTGTVRDRVWSWERREETSETLDSQAEMGEGGDDYPN